MREVKAEGGKNSDFHTGRYIEGVKREGSNHITNSTIGGGARPDSLFLGSARDLTVNRVVEELGDADDAIPNRRQT